MDTFSLGGAWSAGYRFFAQRLALQLLILLGLGIAVPLALQFALFGQLILVGGPLPGQSGTAPAAGPLVAVVQIGGYFLQLASYFTAWRLGFAPGQKPGGALLFGALAGLLAIAVFAIIGIPALFAIGASVASGVPFLGLLVGITLLVLVAAVFYTVGAAFLATIAAIVLVLSMVLSTVSGDVGYAATIIGGGSGAVVVMYLVLSVILLWLTTRLSCTTSVMADWKTYNLIAAIRESWRLTLEDQWAILRYLLLVAFALAVLLIVVSAIAGIGAAAFFRDGSAAPIGGILALGAIVGIPFALFSVFVPAGIYCDLTRSTLAAEVFA